MSRLVLVGAFALLSLAFVSSSPAAAGGSYPDKPIRVIVPLAPGSLSDLVIRAIIPYASKELGTTIYVENRPGGNMAIGATACAKSAPDGYTLCAVSTNAMSFNAAGKGNLTYDPKKDFKPIIHLFNLIEGLLVSNETGISTIEELRTKARLKRGATSFGTFGIGDATDVFRHWLGKEWSADVVGIPYRGGNEIVSALVRGDVDMSMPGIGNVSGLIGEGKVKLLFIRRDQRLKEFPNVPTQAEVGLGNYPAKPAWWGLFVPAGVPDAIISKLNASFQKALESAEVQKLLQSRFLDAVGGTPESFDRFIKADQAAVEKLVESVGLQ